MSKRSAQLVKYLFFLALLIIPLQNSVAQNIEDWTAYTSLRTITDMEALPNGGIAVSTTGGLFIYEGGGPDAVIAEDRIFTTIQGLDRLDGQSLAYDETNDRLWIGYNDGGIDVLTIGTGSIELLEDIRRAENFSPRGINDFEIVGNDLYVATDFGIVNYDLTTRLVKDSFTKIGDFTRGAVIKDIFISDGEIYVATSEGIGFADLSTSLIFAENWSNFDDTNGFVSQPTNTLIVLGNRIYASTSTMNYEFDGANWSVSTQFVQGTILDYVPYPNGLVAIDNNQIFRLNGNSLSVRGLNGEVPTSLLAGINGDSNIYVGTLNEGVGIAGPDIALDGFITPEGPYQNTFSDIQFNGSTLIASSTNESDRNPNIDLGKGYYIFENGEWSNFNAQTNNALGSVNYQLAFTTTITDDFYYFGSWGSGVSRHEIGTDEIVVFDETNTTLRGWEADDPLFPVISGLETDSNGDIWITSRYAENPLYYQIPGDDDWVQLPPFEGLSSLDEYFELFIDSFDQKWVTLQSTTLAGRGLVVIDTGDPLDPDDDTGVKLTDDVNSGFLPDLQVKAITQDNNGEVWVGTERGLVRYIFPELIINGGPEERRGQQLINEDTSAVSRILLRDVNVSAIAVNGANQKWIGSENQGVWLIDDDGSRIIRRFTSENSPLFSNSISSIAINNETGEVFFGTQLGLISFTDIPTQPVSELDELRVYPNPFSYDRHNQIIIDDLSRNTTVRIVGVDGTLINTISAQGGRISWDGRDFRGNRLGTGIYFVIALDEDGDQKGVGKIAIIR